MLAFPIKQFWNIEHFEGAIRFYHLLFHHESWQGHITMHPFIQNYFTFTVITVCHLTFLYNFFIVVVLTTCVYFFSTRIVSRTVIITGHLHRNVLTQKSRLDRDVTRVKRTSSITSGFIFSRSVISRIYFQWNVISKQHFCDQWCDLY